MPEMVFFIFLWVGPNPPSGIGSLWVLLVVLVLKVVMMGDADAAEEGLDDVQQPRLDRL